MRILHATGGRVTPNDFVLASGVNHTAADLSRENNVNPIGAGVQASNSASGADPVEDAVAGSAFHIDDSVADTMVRFPKTLARLAEAEASENPQAARMTVGRPLPPADPGPSR